MKIIELGDFDYKIIIPLIHPFLYQIRGLFHKNEDKPIFTCFTNFCGYMICGIIYLIIRRRMRRNESNELEKLRKINENKSISPGKVSTEEFVKKINPYNLGENQILIEANKQRKKMIRNGYLFILLLAFIYLIPMILDSYASSNRESFIGTSSAFSASFFMFFIIILSRIILGQKIYLHQIISIIIIIISIIIVIVIIFLEKNDSFNYGFVNFAFVILVTALYSLFDVLEKKYYNLFMDSPYHFMFILGLYSSIAILLYEIFTDIIFGYDREFNGIFFKIEKNFVDYGFLYVLIFLGDILSASIWLAGIQLTVYFFTPSHFIISESISQIITTIIDGETIKDFPVFEKIVIYFFFVVILLISFVYNEIIIINVCNLSKDTKKNISIRQLSETEEILLRLKTIDNDTSDNGADKFTSDGLINKD